MPDAATIDRLKEAIKNKKINFSTKKYNYLDLLEGAKVETEHKDTVNNNASVIVNIATDHLDEFKNYYRGLKKMEAKLSKESAAYYKQGFIDKCAEHGIYPK